MFDPKPTVILGIVGFPDRNAYIDYIDSRGAKDSPRRILLTIPLDMRLICSDHLGNWYEPYLGCRSPPEEYSGLELTAAGLTGGGAYWRQMSP